MIYVTSVITDIRICKYFFYQVIIQEYSAYSYAMVLFEIYFLTFCIFHYTEYPVTELCLEYVSILYNLIMYTC